MNYMKSDVHIVKDLPPHLQSLDLEAIGSQVSVSILTIMLPDSEKKKSMISLKIIIFSLNLEKFL